MVQNKIKVVGWECELEIVSFIFDLGPFGKPPTNEINADVLLVREGFKSESEFKSDEKSIELRQNYMSIFKNLKRIMDKYNYWHEFEPPIAVFAVVMAVYLAGTQSARASFMNTYEGLVPTIVLFILNQIGIGRLNDKIFIKRIDIDNELTHELIVALGLGGTLLTTTFPQNPEGFSLILLWFKLLSQSRSLEDNAPYLHLSSKVACPFIKEQLSPLFELWVWEGRIWFILDGQYNALPDSEKRVYLLLAVVLNIKFTQDSEPMKPPSEGYRGSIEIESIWPTESDLIQEFIVFALDGVKKYI